MPEHPAPKLRPHPWKAPRAPAEPEPEEPARYVPAPVAYAELQVTSNFTFLTGASHPEELVRQAAKLGHRAVGITDKTSLAGIVRAHVAAKEVGIPLAIGTRLEIPLDPIDPGDPVDPAVDPVERARRLSLLAYPTDLASYGRLSRLLTRGKLRAEKGTCRLTLDDLLELEEGLLVVLLPSPRDDLTNDEVRERTRELNAVFDDDRFSIAASALFGPDDRGWLARLAELSARTGAPLVATNDVHCHVRRRRFLQDVLTCVRHGCTVEEAGLRLFPNGERHLKTPEEMRRLFAQHERALERSVRVAERAAAFSLDELSYRYPSEIDDANDGSPMEQLVALTWAGARERYPGGVSDNVRARIEAEFRLIDELRYAPYFLTVHDLVSFARSRDILCQGRGAAANSTVCYCLGVTAVDPDRIDLLFERFVSKERNEPPDIDIDFEHERREEVIQYVYGKYGRHRAALTAEVITYRGRSAVRDVGKAMGLSLDCVDRLAKDIDWWNDGLESGERLREHGLDPDDPGTRRTLALTAELIGFPRHLSQHVGGFVITADRLDELVPIENAAMPDRTVIEWDKDDIDALGILKVDVLGLGMLTCVRKTFQLVRSLGVEDETGALASLDMYGVPAEDPAVYDMICDADTVGVFQIESRAQMAMLPRMRPRNFYDLVIDVAIVRPGPIHGDMVHPFLRRRNGEEPVDYPSPAVKKVLERTLGVPLFQEQAMALSMVAAGFTPGEADNLRRAMAAWKRKGNVMKRFGEKLRAGMLENGYSEEFAARFFKQIEGFSEYGFPESHAASFAHIVYVSAWLKRYHPAAFAAGLLNSQPMGFYAPAQLVQDAKNHGVEVRPIDVNESAWDCTLEPGEGEGPALRLGARVAKGLRQDEIERLVAERERGGPFGSLATLRRRAGISTGCLRKLAAADAFGSLGLRSEEALWEILALRDAPPSLFDGEEAARDEPVLLPPRALFDRVMQDYASHRLSLKAHPVAFVRTWLDERDVTPAAALRDEEIFPHRTPVRTAGLVLCRQRPATAKGIFFMTLEDETGISNLVVHPEVFERHRHAARHGILVLAHGRVERSGQVIHVRVHRIDDLRLSREDFQPRSRNFR